MEWGVPEDLLLTSHLVAIALVVCMGVGAQWLAWRLKVPSILLLLGAGLALGPISRVLRADGKPLLDPDAMFGDILGPVVGLAVGLILYEGGLTLRLSEISKVRAVVRNLCTIGAFVTWVLAAIAARFLLGLPWDLCILMGAILTVTGPTVVGPMLAHIRPKGSTGPILRWEGIVVDPIGAILAVLVFEVVSTADHIGAIGDVAQSLFVTVLVGGALGVGAACVLMEIIRRHLAPEFLQNPISLLLVVLAYTLSDMAQHESGLLATTVMGIVLANQKRADVRHILEFKENLRVLLISSLFIVLGARLQPESLRQIGILGPTLFVLALIFLVRPACIFASTIASGLGWKEKVMLSSLAPRGIVAAAVASVFALELRRSAEYANPEQAALLVPLMFAVIIGTVLFYAVATGPIARAIGLSDRNPQGVVFIGAHAWARDIARAIADHGFRVVLIDANQDNIVASRMAGLPTYQGNVLGERTLDELDLTGIGHAIALTPNDEVNALASQRIGRTLGKNHTFQLARKGGSLAKDEVSRELRARDLFDPRATFAFLASRFSTGSVVKATTLTSEFGYKEWRTLYGPRALVLFVELPGGKLQVVENNASLAPPSGSTIIALVDPEDLLLA
jgi:NhaP-type Na+/H+ or K+/H+ antiporter